MNIVWFRQDLRLADNYALSEAAQAGSILPIYILDDVNAGEHKMGAASRVWLHHALSDLNQQLNGHLQVFTGDAAQIIEQLCQQYSVEAVYWNRCYEPWRIQRDKRIKQTLKSLEIAAHSFASLLWEPWAVLKKDATHYQVFTPYFQKGCLMAAAPKRPIAKPDSIHYVEQTVSDLSIQQLGLLPEKAWHHSMMQHWSANEDTAHKLLTDFIEEALAGYKQGQIGRAHV